MFIRVEKIGPYEDLSLVVNARGGGCHMKAFGCRDAVADSDLLDGLKPRPVIPAARSSTASPASAPCRNSGLRQSRANWNVR